MSSQTAAVIQRAPFPKLTAEVPVHFRIADGESARQIIADRKKRGIDAYDEVWEGVYVMPSMPSLVHQKIVAKLTGALLDVVEDEGRGDVYPGANISDRRDDWKEDYRIPDVVVLLKDSRALDCGTFILGGPDFIVEVQSPGDDTEEKIPFYEKLKVHELLIVQRDTRQLRLLRHNGKHLVPVQPTSFSGRKCLVSDVVAMAFRRITEKGQPRVEARRTDGKVGMWVI